METGIAAPLRVLTYNVRRCCGLDGRYLPQRIAEVIAASGAQVIGLQELDVRRPRSGGIDQAMAIADALGMAVHFHPALRLSSGALPKAPPPAGAEATWAEASWAVEDELYGDAVLSALPMRLVKAGGLPGMARRPRHEPRGALWVELDLDGSPVQIVNTHFGLLRRERRRQAEALLGPDWLGADWLTAGGGMPVILMGDFNAPPASQAYRMLAARFRDAQPAAGVAPQATFPSRWPFLRIDHVFVSAGIAVRDARTLRKGPARSASDHCPLSVDLEIGGRAAHAPTPVAQVRV